MRSVCRSLPAASLTPHRRSMGWKRYPSLAQRRRRCGKTDRWSTSRSRWKSTKEELRKKRIVVPSSAIGILAPFWSAPGGEHEEHLVHDATDPVRNGEMGVMENSHVRHRRAGIMLFPEGLFCCVPKVPRSIADQM